MDSTHTWAVPHISQENAPTDLPTDQSRASPVEAFSKLSFPLPKQLPRLYSAMPRDSTEVPTLCLSNVVGTLHMRVCCCPVLPLRMKGGKEGGEIGVRGFSCLLRFGPEMLPRSFDLEP